MVLSFEVSDSRPSTPPLPPDTTYPQPPRDDKDKYTQKDKYEDKGAGNSSGPVLMCIGSDALWLISLVHQCKDKDKDKDKDPTCAIFLKSRRFKDGDIWSMSGQVW